MLENGKPELLVPASSLEVLKVAVMYGADAVYIGGEMYGLRAKAKNFSMEDMACLLYTSGSYLLDRFENVKVDVHDPDVYIWVEIRDKAYVYSKVYTGACGMPLGTNAVSYTHLII